MFLQRKWAIGGVSKTLIFKILILTSTARIVGKRIEGTLLLCCFVALLLCCFVALLLWAANHRYPQVQLYTILLGLRGHVVASAGIQVWTSILMICLRSCFHCSNRAQRYAGLSKAEIRHVCRGHRQLGRQAPVGRDKFTFVCEKIGC